MGERFARVSFFFSFLQTLAGFSFGLVWLVCLLLCGLDTFVPILFFGVILIGVCCRRSSK